MSSPTNIQQMRACVEQLKHESNITRIPVSQASENLMAFCETNVQYDPLVCGISASANPFKDKAKCSVL
ncbi:guanine nucleotide-binding protein G(I)/G(S)/G(O) subunit gamma-7-like [Styela clava]|uniref:guanine nucleotide-binding protein G(I)/G(S)/G(O) subunit gamma-7-like n=1 Tax=Styela clava TaxID=7725 RepID=UPI001939BF54|nr:guanine nucleotide-binding protein G(I)/G(S)/G(O) subunit gamma-7-like [Styela clava]